MLYLITQDGAEILTFSQKLKTNERYRLIYEERSKTYDIGEAYLRINQDGKSEFCLKIQGSSEEELYYDPDTFLVEAESGCKEYKSKSIKWLISRATNVLKVFHGEETLVWKVLDSYSKYYPAETKKVFCHAVCKEYGEYYCMAVVIMGGKSA